MKKNIQKHFNKYAIGTIFLFSLSYFIFLFNNNYYIVDDTQFHIANIIELSNSIKNFIIPKPILPNIANNLGYGIGIFYPRLPHFVSALFYLLTNNALTSIKITHFITIFLSGTFMYILIDKMFNNKKQALLGSLFYISMPYLFVDIFCRDALNESFLFVFIPLIFLGTYYLLQENKPKQFYIYFIIGYLGIMNSHLIMSVFFTIFFLIYLLYFYKQIFNKNNIKHFLIAATFILLIDLPFILPLIEHKLTGLYVVFEKGMTDGVWNVEIEELFIRYAYASSLNSVIYVYNNYLCTIFILATIFYIRKNKINNKDKSNIYSLALFALIAAYFTTSEHIWKLMPSILQNIQFAWRFTTFIAFATSIIGSYAINICKRYENKILIVAIITLLALNYSQIKNDVIYKKENEEYYCSATCGMGWSKEYLPVSTKEYNIDNISSEITNNTSANTNIITNVVPYLEFTINDLNEEAQFTLPRIYYLGYNLKDNLGNNYELYPNEYGMISFKTNNNATYILDYKGTNIDKTSTIISIISLLVLTIYLKVGVNNENRKLYKKHSK